MALVQFLFGGPKRKGFIPPESRITQEIGLELDVVITESPEYTATLSRSEVESGGTVSDHVALQPVKLTIEGVISATPASIAKILQGATFSDLVGDGHRKMKSLYDNKEPFDFVGGFETYLSMVVTSYTPQRNKDTGKALRFTAVLEQVRYASTQTIQAFTKVKSAKPKQNLGAQVTKPASPVAGTKWLDIHSTFQGVEPTAGTIGTLVGQ